LESAITRPTRCVGGVGGDATTYRRRRAHDVATQQSECASTTGVRKRVDAGRRVLVE